MSGYVTQNRVIVEAVKAVCARYEIEYMALPGDWMMRLRKGGQTHFVYAYGFDCNTQAADRIACDKVAAYGFMCDAGVAAVEHVLASSVLDLRVDIALMKSLIDRSGGVVVKPLRGSRGKDVRLFADAQMAKDFVQDSGESDWAASPLVEIVREIRLIVYGGAIVLAYEKLNPVVVGGLKLFNLNKGAQARTLDLGDLDAGIATLARDAMTAIGLELGAVDVVIDASGRAQVLELNSGFSLEHYARLAPENRQRVKSFYEWLISDLFGLSA